MRRTKVMSTGHYSVEISSTNKILYVSAVRLENKNESYQIELEKVKAGIILKEFRDDYKLMI